MDESEVSEFATAKSFPQSNESEQQIEVSELCEKNPSDIFQNKNIDNLLETSFVELERIIARNEKDDLTSYSSGENFFLKTNSLFLQSRGVGNKKIMKNKKIQCQIGSGFSSIMVEIPETFGGKLKRLEILKIIKLLRILFKQLRHQRNLVKQEAERYTEENRQFLGLLSKQWERGFSDFEKRIEEKDLKIQELSEQIDSMQRQNEQFKRRLDFQTAKSSKKIRDLEEENLRSLTDINQEYAQNKHQIEDLTEKLESYENQVSSLTQEINHLNEIVHIRQTQVKRLEYEKHQLEVENKEVNQKMEELFQKYIENQSKYDHQCEISEIKDEKAQEVLRLNELYMKEIESCKEEIRDIQNQKDIMKVETEDTINQELRRYQEYFNEELIKLKKEYNTDILNKNSIINQYISRQNVYCSIIEKTHQSPFPQKIEKLKKQTEKHDAKQQKTISPNKFPSTKVGKQNQSYSKINMRDNLKDYVTSMKKPKSRCSQIAKQNKNKPLLKHMKNRSVDFSSQVFHPQLIFKAQDPSNLTIKLSQYLIDDKRQCKAVFLSEDCRRWTQGTDSENLSFLSKEISRNIKDYMVWKQANH